MIIIDSSVWISYYNQTDSCHKEAYKKINDLFARNKSIIIPENVVSETYTVLLYKSGKEKAQKFIDFVATNKSISLVFINQHIFEKTRFVIETVSQKISFVDASLIALAQDISAELLTFDKEIHKACKSLD